MLIKLIILSFFNKVFFKIIRKPIFQSLDSPQKKENSNLSVVWGDLCWAYGELPMEKRDILVNTELQRLSQEYSRCNFQKKLKSPKSGKRASRRANLNHHHLIILNQNSLSLSLSLAGTYVQFISAQIFTTTGSSSSTLSSYFVSLI